MRRPVRILSALLLVASTAYLVASPAAPTSRASGTSGTADADRAPRAPPGDAAAGVARLDLPALRAWCAARGLPAPPDVERAEVAVVDRLLSTYDELAAAPDADAFGRLGELLTSLEATGGAEHAFRRAAELAPDVFDWSYLRGVLAQDEGRAADAVAHLERAAGLDPDHPTTWARLGQLRFDAGDDTGARDAFRRYLELAPEDGFGPLGMARLELRAGRPQAALPMAAVAARIRPEDFQTQHLLGTIHAALGDTESAARHFEQARRLPQGRWFALRDPLLQRLHERSGTTHALEREFERLAGSGDDATLVALAESILQRRPDDVATLRNLGELHRRAGRHDQALAALDRARELAPEAVDVHVGRANVLLAARRPEQALAAADHALAGAPEHAIAWALRGRALWMLARTAEAEEALRRATTLAPEDAGSYVLLGIAAEARGDVEAAVAAYRRALGARRDEPTALEALRRLGRRF